jgi:hypothetical protein
MSQNRFSSTVALEEKQPMDESDDEDTASLLKTWALLDKRQKSKLAQIMTRPTILPRGDDGELVPSWAFGELLRQKERSALDVALNNTRDGEQASDLEVALYLMCGSLEGPITEQACRIYFHAASKISSSLKEAMESSGIETGPLDEYDSAELVAFKKWIRKQQVEAKNRAKILRFVRMMDGAIIEIENFDLLCAEQQI